MHYAPGTLRRHLSDLLALHGIAATDCVGSEADLCSAGADIADARVAGRPFAWELAIHNRGYDIATGAYARHVARCENGFHAQVHVIPRRKDSAAHCIVSWRVP